MAVPSSIALILTLFVGVSASAFLKPVKDKYVERGEVEQTLTTALKMDTMTLDHYEEDLRPMYASLPKNAMGRIENSTVHYALHRYFVYKHGWYVKGLMPLAAKEDTSSVSTILRDRAPAYIEQLLEQHVSSEGWELRDLAVYVAALSELVRIEAVTDLEAAYKMLAMDISKPLAMHELSYVFDTYLLMYVLDEEHEFESQAQMMQEVAQTWPGWSDFHMWAYDLHSSLDYLERGTRNPFMPESSFRRLARTVEELGHAYGRFQHQECNALKDQLESMEFEGTGRVPLGDFYHVGLGDVWRFWESPEYLRYLGSLDESEPETPMLIIPNFVSGHSNCVASSSFVEVCCSIECDNLMHRLETELASPVVSPERIVKVVSSMPSTTVDAPRNLSAALLSRLNEIAEQHAGLVPLHGRLFAQWMHHAYPLDCPYPAVAATKQLTREEYERVFEGEAVFNYDDQEMISRGYRRQWNATASKKLELPWNSAEDLVSTHWQVAHDHSSYGVREMMLLLAVASMVYPLAKFSMSICGSASAVEDVKLFV